MNNHLITDIIKNNDTFNKLCEHKLIKNLCIPSCYYINNNNKNHFFKYKNNPNFITDNIIDKSIDLVNLNKVNKKLSKKLKKLKIINNKSKKKKS